MYWKYKYSLEVIRIMIPFKEHQYKLIYIVYERYVVAKPKKHRNIKENKLANLFMHYFYCLA